MKERRSTSKIRNEPPRPKTIPDDFIWDPEIEGWYAPGEPSGWDVEAWMREFREELANLSEEERRKGLISVDQLRAAGALDVPAAWRKSLSDESCSLFDKLADDSPDATERGRVEVDASDEAGEQ